MSEEDVKRPRLSPVLQPLEQSSSTQEVVPSFLRNPNVVKFALAEGAKFPVKARFNDVGYDLFALNECQLPVGEGRLVVDTGVLVQLPTGCYATVQPRSGLSAHGVDVVVGLIDPNSTGHIKVIMSNTNAYVFDVPALSKVAQLVIHRYVNTGQQLVSYRELSSRQTDRNNLGFDSSGPFLNTPVLNS